MSIDKLIAKIPTMSPDERKTMRANAEAKAATGDANAAKVLAALDAQDAEENRLTQQARAEKVVELDQASPTARVKLAFELEPTTPGEDKLIQTLLDHPGSTNADLTALHGWRDGAWDMQFGYMCAKRQDFLWPLEPAVRNDLAPNIDMLTIKTRDEEGVLRYRLKPEAIEAFKLLGFRVKSL
ncbi:hypothetical protein GTZ99_06735 [Novosphingobium sp. FSY-8]|uniref:Uncharacterized protein n=1 Tax=Novosphingobium ovatum TaxID=1908523 RepID=A0ABW9XCI0_9SPHN|nr:hypothetical protein [Novosphingobium ovatum]NBC36252.1 hypothetical protein [Novosphingobium ovatum]